MNPPQLVIPRTQLHIHQGNEGEGEEEGDQSDDRSTASRSLEGSSRTSRASTKVYDATDGITADGGGQVWKKALHPPAPRRRGRDVDDDTESGYEAGGEDTDVEPAKRGNKKQKREYVSLEHARNVMKDQNPDEAAGTDEIVVTRKHCWACKNGLLVRHHDKGQVVPEFDTDMCNFIKNSQLKMSTDYLFDEIQYMYETDVRPSYIAEGLDDPGPWSHREIKEHFTEHIVEPTMFLLTTLNLVRDLLRIQGESLLFRQDGVLKMDPVDLRNLGYLIELQRKVLTTDPTKSAAFENELSVAPPKSRTKKEGSGLRLKP